jgi:hypothetical protein
LCGTGGEGGADDRGASIRGIGSGALADPRLGSDARPLGRGEPISGIDIGGLAMRSVAVPCCCTRAESLGRFSTEPRGTPKPAELLRTTSLFPRNPVFVIDTGPRLTAIVLVPALGAFGGANPLGGFRICGCEYHGIHTPPGCQAQPKPGTNNHVP